MFFSDIYLFWDDYFVKSGKLIYDLDRPFSNYIKTNDSVSQNKVNKSTEKLQGTPRKRKHQRTLKNIDKILDNVQISNDKNLLKFRNEKKGK